MSTLEYSRWETLSRLRRFKEIRKVLAEVWTSDRAWDGKMVGLNIPHAMRQKILDIQNRHQIGTMKEVIFKAMVLGIEELLACPPERAPEPVPRRVIWPLPARRQTEQVDDQAPLSRDDEDALIRWANSPPRKYDDEDDSPVDLSVLSSEDDVE